MNFEGGHKLPVPSELMEFIKDLDDMCQSQKGRPKNVMIAWGLSRGARWLEEIVRENAKYLDVAIIIAGYPEGKDETKHRGAARQLIEAARETGTVVCMVHLVSDEFCNVIKYPTWHAEFETQMAAMPALPNFMNITVPGSHAAGEALWYGWDFRTLSPDPQWVAVWKDMWIALRELV